MMTLKPIPVSFFGAILGLGGLSNGWRVASKLYGAPILIADALAIIAFAIWCLLVALYSAKWFRFPEAAKQELNHPVQSFFIVLVFVSAMISGTALLPLLPSLAKPIMLLAVVGQLAFNVWSIGPLWTGGRALESIVPTLYLPATGGNFVSAIALGALGYNDWAMLFFGAALLSWIPMEAVILLRLISQPPLAAPMRAIIGIHLAPPAVACVAYLGLTKGVPDLIASGLIGYGILQMLIALRLWRWIREQAFGAGYWAYSFGIAALPLAALRSVERGATGALETLTPLLFIAANIFILSFAWLSLRLLAQGKYLPPAPPPAP